MKKITEDELVEVSMTKEELEELTGEDPEDVLGEDWGGWEDDIDYCEDIHPRPEDNHQLLEDR